MPVGQTVFVERMKHLTPIAGHIPGAISAPFIDNLDANGTFHSILVLKNSFNQLLGNTSAKDSIIYCGSGVTAAHNILAMVHAGMEAPRLYAGSWSHWITDKSRPVSTKENE